MALRHYLGIAKPSPGNWSISFPAFSGVISVVNTMAEVVINGQDALPFVIDAMRQGGDAILEDYAKAPD